MDSLISRVESFHSTIRTDPMTTFLSNPANRSRMTPQLLRCMSITGISYFLCFGFLILFIPLFVSMPVVYDSSEYWWHCLIALALYAQTMVNFGLVTLKRGFYDGQHSARLPDPSWTKCIDCSHLIPPRAHHCSLCQRCVLRRDHHCFFTGSCVGFENQRYFVVFCFYSGVGAAYAAYITVTYIFLEFLSNDSSVFLLFLPVTALQWLLGHFPFTFLLTVVFMYLCLMTSIGSIAIFVWQMFLVLIGCTSFEYGKLGVSYKTNFLHNIRTVFGSYWLLNFIFPMTCIPIPGDGLELNGSKCI